MKLETRNFLLLPLLPLAFWFLYHYLRTGYAFGNPEFVHYNLASTLHPVRIILAALTRLWQTFAHMNMLLLTAAMLAAMFLPPRPGISRIPIPVQSVFAVLLAAYIAMLSVIGGAVLARYLLPVLPLVIIVAASTLRRRLRLWPVAAAAVGAGFVYALLVNPPYAYPPEENLAYRDAILLHQEGAAFVARNYPEGAVLTAWPLADALRNPALGYVADSLPVLQIRDFSAQNVLAAAQSGAEFDVALLFSTKPQPETSLLGRWHWWQRLHARYFDHHQDLPPEAAAAILGGRIVWLKQRRGQWLAVVVIERDELARESR